MVIDRPRRLSIRIAEDEWTMLQALAEREGLSASDFVRHFIRKSYALTIDGQAPRKHRQKK